MLFSPIDFIVVNADPPASKQYVEEFVQRRGPGRQIGMKDDHGKGLDVITKIILRKTSHYLSLEERVS